MISPEEAWQRLARHLAPLDPVTLPRRDALGAVLARPVAARDDLPAADVSALDGYALGGPAPAEARLPVAFTVAAGDPPGASLPAGAAARVMTGAPVPAGADRVIGIEATEPLGSVVRLRAPAPEAGNAIRRRAEVLAAGSPLLPAGARLGATALAALAAQGIASVVVHRPPRVAVLATGDEVVAPDRDPRPGELRDSHTDYLLAAGRRLGLEFASLGIAPDDPERLAERVAEGLASDVLVTCGGVSAGAFDHAEAVFARLGCAPIFDAVAIQPGKPLVAAHRGSTLIFGLPGNPTSVVATFALFVAPALDRLRGGGAAFWSEAVEVEVTTPFPAGGRGRDRFLPARRDGSPRRVAILPSRGSHDLVAFATAELLVRARAGEAAREPGARAEAIALP